MDWLLLLVIPLAALMIWLSRKTVVTFITKGIEHRFDTKLEALRAELRAREAEIKALRDGVLTAMSTRHIAFDKRRLDAVDELWASVIELGPAKAVSSMLAVMNLDEVLRIADKKPEIRELFRIIGSNADPAKFDYKTPARARPFVSPMSWALFSAYQAIATSAVLRVHLIKTGMGRADLIDSTAIAKVVKVALPHRSEFIDKYGHAGLHHLLDELEQLLLEEFHRMLTGMADDKERLETAAEILRLSNTILKNPEEQL